MAYAHDGSVRLHWRQDGAPECPALLLLVVSDWLRREQSGYSPLQPRHSGGGRS